MTKLSRSKIELFLDCPRCFWLETKQGVKRPPMFPYTINNAIDYLLKQEFDAYREKGAPHPIMVANNIDAIPYQSSKLNQWRHNFTGVQHHDKDTDFLVYGAVDDIWVNPDGEVMVVDYKATGANQHHVQDSYRRQMEIYQWLLRKNGLDVSPMGYFVFARADKSGGFGNGKATLPFDIFIENHQGDSSWLEQALTNARSTFDAEKIPDASPECVYCQYRSQGSRFV
jgi:hypothetical protein